MKKWIALLLALTVVFALAACGTQTTTNTPSPTNAPTETKTPVENNESLVDNSGEAKADAIVADTCRIAIESLSTLDLWGTNNGTEPLYEIYQMLFMTDSTGALFPVLADAGKGEFGGYDHEAGTGDYTVYIYDYITDHAGNKITASDVKWCYEHAKNSPDITTSGWDAFEGIDIVNDYEMVFRFSHEMNKTGELVNFFARQYIVSEKAYNESESKLTVDCCGTGPYKLEKFESGSAVTLVKNEDYWQKDELRSNYQLANVNKIVYTFIDDDSQQIIALQTGEVDIVSSVKSDNIAAFSDGYNVYQWIQKGLKIVAPNCSEESICGDLNMRLAIMYAIDVQGIAQLKGDAVLAATSLMASSFPEYDPAWETWENYQRVTDLDLVKDYLTKANYNGEEVRIFCEPTHSSDGEIIVNMLTAAGIKATLNPRERNALKEVKSDPAGWDLVIDRNAGNGSGSDQFNKFWAYSNSKTGETTQTFIKDDEWEALLQELRVKETATAENFTAWMQHAYDNAYGLPLYSDVNNIVFRDFIATVYRTDKNVLVPGAFTYNSVS